MATWRDFCNLAGVFGGRQVGENAWMFEVGGYSEGRTQKVFALHEIMQPDFEFLQFTSAFAMIETVDCALVLKNFGQLNVGSIGYSPVFDAGGSEIGGFLNLSTSMPLAALDLTDPTTIFLYLNIFARAADNIEQRLSGS